MVALQTGGRQARVLIAAKSFATTTTNDEQSQKEAKSSCNHSNNKDHV